MKMIGLALFLTGAAVGGAVALLLAPKSGKETRKQVKEATEEIAGKFERMRSGSGIYGHEHIRHGAASSASQTVGEEQLRTKKPEPVI